LGKPETFDRAMIDECVDYGVRVKAFQLQCQKGGNWTTFYKGTTIGKNREVKFDPVTAQRIRLNIEAKDGPTINEFQLFAPAGVKRDNATISKPMDVEAASRRFRIGAKLQEMQKRAARRRSYSDDGVINHVGKN
jgi:hypothetical protein